MEVYLPDKTHNIDRGFATWKLGWGSSMVTIASCENRFLDGLVEEIDEIFPLFWLHLPSTKTGQEIPIISPIV
jgi:hypothetical protein